MAWRNRLIQKTSGSRSHGFTMIELLIVTVILSILAAAVIFALGGVSTQSAQAACNSDAKSVETAIEAFQDNPMNKAAANQYPDLGAAGQTELTASASSNYGGPYLRTWPDSPNHYTITLDATTQGQVDVTPAGTSTPLSFDGILDPCSSVP
jgi:prepilin-type N-terminal cleavage/methylation domain-containing protein